MQNETKYMNELIKDLLEYAKAGHNKEKKEKIDLNSVVNEIIEENSVHPSIVFEINNTLPNILFNKTHIIQVFENLIGNAVKYMNKPKGEVKIGCEEQENHWIFFVSDNGSGIEEKYFDKIFQPFEKAHNRKDVQSTGIGLSIVKKIIENSGGKVWVESEVGKGSTFYFEILKIK